MAVSESAMERIATAMGAPGAQAPQPVDPQRIAAAMGAQQPHELDQNPFTQRRSPNNPEIDLTNGRGFSDRDDPDPLTRAALATARKNAKKLKVASDFARKNSNFNRVLLTRQERIDFFEELSTDPANWERIAGVHGAEAVKEAQEQYRIDKFSEDESTVEQGTGADFDPRYLTALSKLMSSRSQENPRG